MKKSKLLLLAAIIIVVSSHNAHASSLFGQNHNLTDAITPQASTTVSNEVFGISSEIEIDISSGTIQARDGLNAIYGPFKVQVNKVQRDNATQKVILSDNFIAQMTNTLGEVKIEAKSGELSQNGTYGIFYDTIGYVDISRITGAEAPNGKVYFGGDKIEYVDGKIVIKDGYLTTDYAIESSYDPKTAGYHFIADDISIEPDKQITMRKMDLYHRDKKSLPFPFPWLRVNIRSGSTVPLFPEWTTSKYFGWTTSCGMIYNSADNKYQGGFAPTFADQMGLLVGRMENWYDFGSLGKSRLNIDDWLVYTKVDKKLEITDPIAYEEKHKRYKLNYNHSYSGKYGHLNLDAIYSTLNNINDIDDVVRTYANRNWFDNAADETPTPRPRLDSTVGFYSLDTALHSLGTRNDISITSKIHLTDDKKAYSYIVYDEIDDVNYGSQVDHDLFSQIQVTKDNDDYKIGAYYNYLYDMDPGSTFADTQSIAEDFGFEILDKHHNIGISYDERNGDKYRRINTWERDPNLDSSVTIDSLLGSRFKYSYNPSMVRQYIVDNSKNLRISLGDYELPHDYAIKAGIDANYILRELDTRTDRLRTSGVKNNDRDTQYNRYEDVIYRNQRETRGYATLYDDTVQITLAGGETQSTIYSREGLYDGTYHEYNNNSIFYEIGVSKDKISLGNNGRLGEIAIGGTFRLDEYDATTSGAIAKTDKIGKNDSTLNAKFTGQHIVKIFDNTGNNRRTWDTSITNDLNVTYDTTSFSGDDSTKTIRLYEKDTSIAIKDSVGFELGNTYTTYTLDMITANDSANKDNKRRDNMRHTVDFELDEQKKISVYYGEDARYTDKNTIGENYTYLTYGNYGGTISIRNHEISYSRQSINLDLKQMQNIDDASEKIKDDAYRYVYTFPNNDRLSLTYGTSTGKRYNITSGDKEIDSLTESYYVSYLDAGDIERRYTAGYERYAHNEEASKTLSVGTNKYNRLNGDVYYFGFDYNDKRLTRDELRAYGAREFDKDSSQVTDGDILELQNILASRRTGMSLSNFNVHRIADSYMKLSDSRVKFNIWAKLQKNQARYESTGDFMDSLSDINGGLFFQYKRTGIGYTIDVNNGWNGNTWQKTDTEHKVSLHLGIGKPSQGWEIKTYGTFYENFYDTDQRKYRKHSLDEIGVEIGKDMGYYQISAAYETEFDYTNKRYDWKAGIQFKLLAIPQKPLFLLGAKNNSRNASTTAIDLFNGIKPEKHIED